MSRDAGAAVGQGGVIELSAVETYKKSRYQLCSFLFSNNGDLKNNNRNFRKTLLNFLGPRMAAINLLQSSINPL